MNENRIDAAVELIANGKIDAETALFLMDHPQFEQKPVDVKTFIESEHFLNCPDAWPEIKIMLVDLFDGSDDEDKFSRFREFVFSGGIGSGKSFLVSCIFCYIVYWLLCLENPQKFFGLAEKSVICLINTSTTAGQAKKVVFGKIQARIDSSPWFQQYGQPNPKIRSEMRFPKDIVIFPGSSSETAPIGYDVLVYLIDEASFFVETDTHSGATQVYTTLDRRITSRFGKRGLGCTISSPRYVDDFTEKKYQESRTKDYIKGVRRATWETKPDDIAAVEAGDYFVLTHPVTRKDVKIPKVYETDFEKDSKKAWRDFGAVASLALEPFFTDEELDKLEKKINTTSILKSVVNNRINPALRGKVGARYRMHIDLGIKRDCCGVGLAHEEAGGDKIVLDALIRIASEKRAEELAEKEEPVDMIIGKDQVIIDDVLDLIDDFADLGFDIEKVTFDGYQSTHSMQILERNGYLTGLISCDRNTAAYDDLKASMNSPLFECPPHAHFLKECRRLELIKGKKVDHAEGATKDVADGAAGAVHSIMQGMDDTVQETQTEVDETNTEDIQEEI